MAVAQFDYLYRSSAADSKDIMLSGTTQTERDAWLTANGKCCDFRESHQMAKTKQKTQNKLHVNTQC